MSLSKDIKRLRSDTKLSLGELSEFAQRLRGKSVPEALGTIAQSQLGRALIEASGVFAIVLVLGTVPFYFVGGGSASPTQAAATQSPAPDDPTTTKEAVATSGSASATSTLPATVEEAEKKLGIDTKPPSLDSKVNPLESKADDLLKDLK